MKSHVGRERQACPLHLSSAPPAPLGFLPVAKTILAAGQSPAAERSPLSSEQPPVSRVSLPSKTSSLSSSSGYPSGRTRMTLSQLTLGYPGWSEATAPSCFSPAAGSFFSHQSQHHFYTGTQSLERFLLARPRLLKMGSLPPVSVLSRALHAARSSYQIANMQGVSLHSLIPSPQQAREAAGTFYSGQFGDCDTRW